MEEIWLSYFSFGGNAQLLELEAYIYGVDLLTENDLELLDCALQDAAAP